MRTQPCTGQQQLGGDDGGGACCVPCCVPKMADDSMTPHRPADAVFEVVELRPGYFGAVATRPIARGCLLLAEPAVFGGEPM